VNRLDEKLRDLAAERRVGLMAHLVAGYRTREESRAVALNLAAGGADILEIQIPFSDPTADGPVITAACQAALLAGARPRDALKLAGEVAAASGLPVLLMSYFNILFRWPGGLAAFAREAAERGITGTIVPDIPPEEGGGEYHATMRRAGLHPILVVSPNVPEKRLRDLAPHGSGLVYATARVGTTGAATDLGSDELRDFLSVARRALGLPLAVGFGIHERRQIEALAGLAEVAVVGTRFLRTLESGGPEGVLEEARRLATRAAP